MGACEGDSVNMPISETSAIGLTPAFSVSYGCPSGYVCQEPIRHDPIRPDLDTIATNCPEACRGAESGVPVSFQEDANGWYDHIGTQCPTRSFKLCSSNPDSQPDPY